jgi:hypothetical protein
VFVPAPIPARISGAGHADDLAVVLRLRGLVGQCHGQVGIGERGIPVLLGQDRGAAAAVLAGALRLIVEELLEARQAYKGRD